MKQELSDAELNTYARQIVLSDIGYDGQLKLRNATACIVGLGGLGSLIAPTLVGMGIGQLRLVEETCARDGQRTFVITPTERIDLDLSLLGRTHDEMGFSIKTSGSCGITFVPSHEMTVCILKRGGMIAQTSPMLKEGSKKDILDIYRSVLVEGMGFSSGIVPDE